MVIVFYYKFDKDYNDIPFFVMCIPFSVLLLATAVKQMWDLVYEKDPIVILLYGYNAKIKLIATVIGSLSTVTYIITMMPSLYLIQ